MATGYHTKVTPIGTPLEEPEKPMTVVTKPETGSNYFAHDGTDWFLSRPQQSLQDAGSPQPAGPYAADTTTASQEEDLPQWFSHFPTGRNGNAGNVEIRFEPRRCWRPRLVDLNPDNPIHAEKRYQKVVFNAPSPFPCPHHAIVPQQSRIQPRSRALAVFRFFFYVVMCSLTLAFIALAEVGHFSSRVAIWLLLLGKSNHTVTLAFAAPHGLSLLLPLCSTAPAIVAVVLGFFADSKLRKLLKSHIPGSFRVVRRQANIVNRTEAVEWISLMLSAGMWYYVVLHHQSVLPIPIPFISAGYITALKFGMALSFPNQSPLAYLIAVPLDVAYWAAVSFPTLCKFIGSQEGGDAGAGCLCEHNVHASEMIQCIVLTSAIAGFAFVITLILVYIRQSNSR